MAKKLGKRLMQMLVMLFGITLISYLLLYLSPGDPVRAMFTASGTIPSEEIIQAMREEMGLNQPFFIQYGNWLLDCLRGDFGTSISMGAPVADLLLVRLWPTLQLAGLSLGMMVALAVPTGILCALHQNKLVDNILRSGTFVAISMPNFWVGLLLLYLVAMKLKWLPVMSSSGDFTGMILPALTLAIAMSGKYARQVRTAILEELNRDYIVGARSRGLSNTVILWKHILPNAMLPLVTLLGLSMGSLLGGTAVVEVIFSYPALGSLALSAISSMDYALIQGYVLWVALVYMVVNLIVDISYSRLDPRLKGGKQP